MRTTLRYLLGAGALGVMTFGAAGLALAQGEIVKHAPAPASAESQLLWWILFGGGGTALAGFVVGIVKSLWTRLTDQTAAHKADFAAQGKSYADQFLEQGKSYAAQIEKISAQHTAQLERVAVQIAELKTEHSREIAELRDRLEREQRERREDVERLHKEHKEIMRTSMTTFGAVATALDRCTEQIARMDSGGGDNEDGG